MAFISEIVPDADKKRIDFARINYPFPGRPAGIGKWVVDRERDIFLIATQVGTVDGPEINWFAMGWKGEFIRLELDWQSVGNKQDGYVDKWRIRQIWIPDPLAADKPAIVLALKEALEVWVNALGDKYKRSLDFDF
jgi:hypothetical protein